jgi:hypothetical protein
VLINAYPPSPDGDWNLVDPVVITISDRTYTPVSARAATGLIRVRLTGSLPSGLTDPKATVGNEDSNSTKLPFE